MDLFMVICLVMFGFGAATKVKKEEPKKDPVVCAEQSKK